MKTKVFWITLMTAALALLASLPMARADTAEIAIIRADKTRIPLTVELALTESAQEQGLMFREELAQGHGMLFVYEKPMRRKFWMKDTLIPLDILFFDGKGRVMYIVDRAVPHSLETVGPDGRDVCTVLELGGGEAKRLGIGLGDRLAYKAAPTCQ